MEQGESRGPEAGRRTDEALESSAGASGHKATRCVSQNTMTIRAKNAPQSIAGASRSGTIFAFGDQRQRISDERSALSCSNRPTLPRPEVFGAEAFGALTAAGRDTAG